MGLPAKPRPLMGAAVATAEVANPCCSCTAAAHPCVRQAVHTTDGSDPVGHIPALRMQQLYVNLADAAAGGRRSLEVEAEAAAEAAAEASAAANAAVATAAVAASQIWDCGCGRGSQQLCTVEGGCSCGCGWGCGPRGQCQIWRLGLRLQELLEAYAGYGAATCRIWSCRMIAGYGAGYGAAVRKFEAVMELSQKQI